MSVLFDPPNPSLATVTVHASRTLMLAELSALFAAVPPQSPITAYQNAVVGDNVLLKSSYAGRQKTFLNLRQLYGLQPGPTLFGVFRTLWEQAPVGRPLLALLAAWAVDEILRATTPLILGTKESEQVTPEQMAQHVVAAFPNRYGTQTLEAIGQRTASSWLQSGHLRGRLRKVRSRAVATPETLALALFIGLLSGERGFALFATPAVQLQDVSPADHDALAFAAARRGYFKYRRLGDVAEVDFTALLTSLGEPRV